MRRARLYLIVGIVLTLALAPVVANAKPPARSKFYNFSKQLVDGEIKKPTNPYIDTYQRVRFDRLLWLKKSFVSKLFKTAKEKSSNSLNSQAQSLPAVEANKR